MTGPTLEPPVTHRPLGNYDGTCRGYLDNHKAAPRDLATDLARLDERINLLAAATDPGRRAYETERTRSLLALITTEARDMPNLSGDDDCGFEGRVDADWYASNRTYVWTCPRCGHTNEDEVD